MRCAMLRCAAMGRLSFPMQSGRTLGPYSASRSGLGHNPRDKPSDDPSAGPRSGVLRPSPLLRVHVQGGNMAVDRNLIEDAIFGWRGSQRFTQDSPVLPDVWIEYALRPGHAVGLLLEPSGGTSPATVYR